MTSGNVLRELPETHRERWRGRLEQKKKGNSNRGRQNLNGETYGEVRRSRGGAREEQRFGVDMEEALKRKVRGKRDKQIHSVAEA